MTDEAKKEKLEKPWRDAALVWDVKHLERLRSDVKKYRPPKWLNVPHANLLLAGYVGAGKSSFINTVNSLFRGHITLKAAAGSSEHSLTTTFRMHEIRSKVGGRSMNFRLCDTMGLEETYTADSANFSCMLDGNISDRFQFNATTPIGPGTLGYNAEAKLKDKVHVVVFVIDCTSVNVLNDVILDKLKAMRAQAIQRGIPLMILMTKVDKLDQLVATDLKNVYLSADVRDTVEALSNKTGIPMSYIMPVKSYERETELESSIDILALTALRQMLRLADDYFEDQMDSLGISPGSGTDSDEAEDRSVNIRGEDRDGE